MKLTYLFLGITSLVLAGCGRSTNEEKLVLATLFPQFSIADQLAGDLVEVKMIIPVGSDPHEFEPTPVQRVQLNTADVVFYTSETFEAWMHTIEESATGHLVDLSSSVRLIDGEAHDHTHAISYPLRSDDHEHDEDKDPHYWVDPANGLLMLSTIAEELIELLPEHQLLIESREQLIKEALEESVELYEALVDEGEDLDVVFAGHNAFGYLEQYHIHVLTPYPGFSSDVVPTAQSIIDFLALMNELETDILYVASTDNVAVVDALLEAKPELETETLYTLENISQAQFVSEVRYQELIMINYEALSHSEQHTAHTH